MTRANRVFVPGHIWHITQRCHQREFLLKAQRDRRCWIGWLGEARRRYGLCVLNYIVTRNHVHLLVRDCGQNEIAAAMQLVAGRTAQTYNDRKGRLGAFWQDRYHATAVESEGHLARCMAYIDLNMVRAGAVAHPRLWPDSGYCEMLRRPQRYRIIDMPALCQLVACETQDALHARWIRWTDSAVVERPRKREPAWTESLAVGSEAFVRGMQRSLGSRAAGRELLAGDDGMARLREPVATYWLRGP